MLKMTNILEQDQREVPSFFCKILEGPRTCPCPAQTVQRGNGEMLPVLLKVTGREKKKKFTEIPFCKKKINIYLFINMQKTHTERADGQKCHGVKIGEGVGWSRTPKMVYNILKVP